MGADIAVDSSTFAPPVTAADPLSATQLRAAMIRIHRGETAPVVARSIRVNFRDMMKQIAETALFNQFNQSLLLGPNIPQHIYNARGCLSAAQLELALIRLRDNKKPKDIARSFGVNCNAMTKQVTQSALANQAYYLSLLGAVDDLDL